LARTTVDNGDPDGPGRGTLGGSHVFHHVSRTLVVLLLCLFVGVAAPAYADHKPSHGGGGDKPDMPGKPDDPGKPDKPADRATTTPPRC